MIQDEIRPRYLEALEESLNDTAHLLAALLERDATTSPDPTALRDLFSRAQAREFNARIYSLRKQKVNIKVYVTDARGIVIYDSEGKSVGKDFSQWNDVRRALRGEYGVRATRVRKEDPNTGSLYVAAPVRRGDLIVGEVTVIKPNDSIQPFVRIAERRLLQGAGFAVIALTVLALTTFFWVTRPIRLLTDYVNAVRAQKRPALPDVGGGEIGNLARAFEEMRSELEGKAYVQQYVRTMAHEIKSPVTSIRAAAEILAENPEPESRERFTRNILTESARIEEMTRKLLDLSAVEGQKSLDTREYLSANDILSEAVRRCAVRLGTKNQSCVAEHTEDARISGSKVLLESALINLIENASDFSPASSVIRAGFRKLQGPGGQEFVEFFVQDQGPGVPEYALSRVFERFYSLPRPDGRKSTGLGLCFVRETALLHNGEASIENGETGAVARLRISAS